MVAAKPARLALGAGLVLAAAFLISVQDVIIKKAGADMPLWQIFSLRAVIGVPLILVLAGLPRIMGGPVTGWSGLWPTLRSLCIAFGLFLPNNYTADSAYSASGRSIEFLARLKLVLEF